MSNATLWLARYFHVPSRSGFSPYRTGWATHVAFSAVVATGLFQLAVRQLGFPVAAGIAVALFGVWLVWGLGVAIGVASHYNLLLMACPILLFFAAMLYWPPLLLGFGIAAVAHVLMGPLTTALYRMSGRSDREEVAHPATEGRNRKPPRTGDQA